MLIMSMIMMISIAVYSRHYFTINEITMVLLLEYPLKHQSPDVSSHTACQSLFIPESGGEFLGSPQS